MIICKDGISVCMSHHNSWNPGLFKFWFNEFGNHLTIVCKFQVQWVDFYKENLVSDQSWIPKLVQSQYQDK